METMKIHKVKAVGQPNGKPTKNYDYVEYLPVGAKDLNEFAKLYCVNNKIPKSEFIESMLSGLDLNCRDKVLKTRKPDVSDYLASIKGDVGKVMEFLNMLLDNQDKIVKEYSDKFTITTTMAKQLSAEDAADVKSLWRKMKKDIVNSML